MVLARGRCGARSLQLLAKLGEYPRRLLRLRLGGGGGLSGLRGGGGALELGRARVFEGLGQTGRPLGSEIEW